jgi:hypothetical protein
MSPIPLGILASAGAAPANAFELIQSTLISTDTESVTFSNLGSTAYRHLQVRGVLRCSNTTSALDIRFNGVVAANYVFHRLRGNGVNVQSAASQFNSRWSLQSGLGTSAATSNYATIIVDILDFKTVKNPTIRIFYGQANATVSNWVALYSGTYPSAEAINTLFFQPDGGTGNFAPGSRLSLYGIRG